MYSFKLSDDMITLMGPLKVALREDPSTPPTPPDPAKTDA